MLRHGFISVIQCNTSPGIFTPLVLKVISFSHLIKTKAFVNGDWISSASGKTFNVINPSTGATVASVSDLGASEATAAIQAADAAFAKWRHVPAKERCDVLARWFQALTREADALAALITAENGKPLSDSTAEVAYGNNFIDWFVGEGRRYAGEVISSPVASKRLLSIHQPIGPTAIITPWNFPHAMITRKVGAAIAAGCSVVVKPAEDTPLCALAMAQLAQEAGVPPGVFNVVTASRESSPAVGQTFCESPLVRCLSFTGSTPVGRLLLRQCADTVKRVSLELGGHAPFVIFESGNVAKAVRGAMSSKFRCSGQTCVTPNRFFVHASKYDAFLTALVSEVAKLKIGDGTTPGTNQGPLINAAAVDKVERHVQDAVHRGARVLIGGKRLSGNFFEPTVLADCTTEMLCLNEETFGPLVPVVKFTDEAETMRSVNALEVGLAGYFYSEDLAQIWRVAEAMEVGMVGVNEALISGVEIPFGGVKQSGLGREGGSRALEHFQEVKYICMGNIA